MSTDPLKAVVVGCRMGRAHARALADLDDYALAGLCDLNADTARNVAEKTGNPEVFTDLSAMLAEVQPDVVAIATPTDSHSALTRQAVDAGAKGVYCEKPMATCLSDANEMVGACRRQGVALVVNHQRRINAPFRGMLRLIEDGAIGEVELIRGTCAGDMLSDGTHTVDTLLHLAGDAEVAWVLGQIYRETPNAEEERSTGYETSGGWRYGHIVETGVMATFEFGSGVRGEILTGGVRFPGRGYQDIEVIGTEGRLWRPGDKDDPTPLIQDGQAGGWREIEMNDSPGTSDPIADAYSAFARTIREGAPHPMCGDNALRGFEVVMAIYESARLNTKVDLPLQQTRFPLEIMAEDGRI
jgi:UDP-N-acetyl-2-amino-2-deoxyglucuronate dehydrogenase